MEWNVIRELQGKTFTRVEQSPDEIHFYDDVNKVYVSMYHSQDCCESVYIEDLVGDINDLVGTEILSAVESYEDDKDDQYGVGGWTFYTIRTIKGTVDIRWYGSSNGYYSIGVDVIERNMP